MNLKVLVTAVCMIFTGSLVTATEQDGKPWDWKDYASITDRDNPRQESNCGSAAIKCKFEISNVPLTTLHGTNSQRLSLNSLRPAKTILIGRSQTALVPGTARAP